VRLSGRGRWGLLATLGAMLAVSLLASASALAVPQRGHEFSFHFGSAGKGAGKFSAPSAVAVNSVTGDVYVADRKQNEVEQFEPVVTGGELTGETFVRQFKVSAPEGIAVDNSPAAVVDPSRGDVYVVSSHVIEKFSAEGAELDKISKLELGEAKAKKFATIEGVAVDQEGHLLVSEEDARIARFDNAEHNVAESEQSLDLGETIADQGLAVDSEGNLFVGASAALADPEEDRPLESLFTELREEFAEAMQPLAVAAKVDGVTGSVLIPGLDYEAETGIAVNPASEPANGVEELNDAYVVNVAGEAGERVSTIAQFAPQHGTHEQGQLIQRFGSEAGAPRLGNADGIAVDSGSGPSSGAVYVADATSDTVDVFELERAAAPKVADLSALSSSGLTTLSATVDPTGSDTHYRFEFGTSSCAVSSCTQTTSTDVGAGFADQSASAQIHVAPGTYRFRIVAENTHGEVDSSEQTFSVFEAVSGLPDGRAWEMVSPAKKDGAEPEALTKEGGTIQAAENGQAISYVADGPMPAEQEPEGNRSPEFPQILSVRGAGGWASQNITTPNETGTGVLVEKEGEYQIFSPNLALGLVEPSPETNGSGPLARPPLAPPESKTEEENGQQKTFYLRDDKPLLPEAAELANYEAAKLNGEAMHNPGYVALVTELNAPGPGPFGGGLKEGVEFASATPDLSHVAFKSFQNNPGLYEWVGRNESLQLISQLPKTGVREANGTLGGPGGIVARNAISNDGTQVVWSSTTGHLYVRDIQTQETLLLDEIQSGVSEEGQGPAHAVYQTASTDGSKVFFTDTQRLTTTSTATVLEPQLYVVETEVKGGHLIASLKDLTPQKEADVLVDGNGGGVLGASDDGSYLYFVANGALTTDSARGHCSPEGEKEARPPGTTCNLYMLHFVKGAGWAPPKLIAVLSAEDLPDWGAIGQGALGKMTSRVSPDGEYLAFMSERSLTGYDNEDITSKEAVEHGKARRLDEEVFLYSAHEERVICVSCNPSGAQPAGVFDIGNDDAGHPTGEGLGLVVDRPQVWGKNTVDRWLAGSVPGWTVLNATGRAVYQSRYLSDSGRLFFNSPDHLVPAATGPKEKVYEYEPDHEGSCTSVGGCIGLISPGNSEHEAAFLDASKSGNDVFFLTADPLAPQDVDSSFDVYDARVCGATCPTAPEAPKPPCDEETIACKGAATTAPDVGAPGSSTATGSGNLTPPQGAVLGKTESKPPPKPKPLTRAQKLAKALKQCRTKYKAKSKKSKRLTCEKQARKKYGPPKPKAGKSSSRGTSR
jgi:WD40-like Beta Propeller Repeat